MIPNNTNAFTINIKLQRYYYYHPIFKRNLRIFGKILVNAYSDKGNILGKLYVIKYNIFGKNIYILEKELKYILSET